MKSDIAIRSIIAVILILMGAAVVLVSVVALLDPVGTKHADDADPFGPPASRAESAVILLVGCGFLVVAGFVIYSAIKRARVGAAERATLDEGRAG